MRKRLLSAFLVLAMTLSLIPAMSVAASAEEPEEKSEVIAFNGSSTAESEHFTLNGVPYHDYWYVESYTITPQEVTITAKDPNTKITAIDVAIGYHGYNYNIVQYSSGEKLETGVVEDYSTAHVVNINSDRLVISCFSDFTIRGVTVYYIHEHNFTGEGRDNGDGTHSKKCSSADCSVYGVPAEHTYKPLSKVSDNPLIYSGKCTDCPSTVDNFPVDERSFDYTGSTTYGAIDVNQTLKGGTKLKANYSFGDAEMIVYVDGAKVAEISEGGTWTATQCVECVKFDSHMFSSDPLEMWFKTICDSYTIATCEAPESCVYCGHTRGEKLPHTWADVTCTTPKTCTYCGATDGEPLGHDYRLVEKKQNETETSPAIYTAYCTRCDYTTENLEVSTPDYTYDTTVTSKTIKVGDLLKKETVVTFEESGLTTYSALSAKIFIDNVQVESINRVYSFTVPCCLKCVQKSTISDIYDAVYFETACDFAESACTAPETCVHCGYTRGDALGHNFADGVCTVCGAVQSLIVGADETLDLGGETLTVEEALTVNNGGKVVNGALRIKDGAVVSLGENGGWVPVPTGSEDGYTTYELREVAVKLGKTIADLGTGARFALGYKYAEYAAYGDTAAAAEDFAGVLKLGACISFVNGDNELSGDLILSKDSIAKMTEVEDDAEAFYRANISLKGSGVKSISAAPLIAVKALGFRLQGAEGNWVKK